MAFKKVEVDKLLVQCHRRCCICHRYCGVKIEIDHIEPKAEKGKDKDNIKNAIPVCFECHAEIHLYNPKHPKGRRFTPEELRQHRVQWFKICSSRPDLLTDQPHSPNPGSLERILHELEFNEQVADNLNEIGCPFETSQFSVAIAEGTFSWLSEKVRQSLQHAYLKMKRANFLLMSAMRKEHPRQRGSAMNKAQGAIKDAKSSILSAQKLIRSLLKKS